MPEEVAPKVARASAFAMLSEGDVKAHRISPSVTFDKSQVIVTFKVNDIAMSKKSTGDKGSIGFVCEPVLFEVEGKRYALRPNWVTLSAL